MRTMRNGGMQGTRGKSRSLAFARDDKSNCGATENRIGRDDEFSRGAAECRLTQEDRFRRASRKGQADKKWRVM